MSKVILITGASAGFGELAAEKLLAKGHSVYVAARRTEKMEKLEKLGATVLTMDVADTASVEAGVKQLLDKENRIDVVFANAGYGSYGTIEDVELSEIENQFNVNVFGVVRTIQAVLPKMREQGSGRIVITASVVSHVSVAGMGYYAATKHALAAIGNALRQEVADLGIEVALIKPGAVKTEFDVVAFDKLDQVALSDDYKTMMRGFKNSMTDSYASCPGPESTAKAMVAAAEDAKMKTDYRTTTDAKFLPKVAAILPDKMFDKTIMGQIKKAAK